MKPALEINDVSITYHSQIAVQHINLIVNEGEFVVITGPNGGGKSSLIKAILNFVPVTTGKIKIYGKDFKEVKGEVGYVPQQTHFDHTFPLTVRDIVLMGRLPAKTNWFYRYSKEDRAIVDQLLETMNLKALAHRNMDELSGGQKQKVLIARALSSQPRILILDEPTASLDAKAKQQIYEALKVLSGSMTIIMISHDTQIISHYASSIVLLNKEILYKGKELPNFDINREVWNMEVLHEY